MAEAEAIFTRSGLAQRPLAVLGRRNAVLAWSTRLLPRTWAAALAARLIRDDPHGAASPAVTDARLANG